MNLTLSFYAAGLLLAGISTSHATLAMWQAEVGTGAAPAATKFTTTAGGAPVIFNVGALSGDRSFEFIVNSPVGGFSQALIGTQDVANGRQGLKFDQWQSSGVYGVTDFGVVDLYSTTPSDYNRNVDVVFTSDGASTNMYTDGIFRFNFATGLRMMGNQGLGAGESAGSFFDVMAGDILGFASYDSALSAAEITQHQNAFAAIPEPCAAALAALISAGVMARRRRPSR